MATRTAAPTISTRPLRHLVDLWLVLALYISIKGVGGNVDKSTTWGFFWLAAALIGIWLIGRSQRTQAFFGVLLSETDSRALHSANTAEHSSETPVPFTIPMPALQQRRSTWNVCLWCFGGFAFVALLLAVLEIRQPFYFVQDDNLSQFLPVVLQGCRSLLNDGIFPTWNPHQFLGSPTTSLGTYALTYPPTYISYAIARWIVGNEAATFEVFCIGHLLAGYLGAFWACRVMQIRPSLAASASACFAISGFFLIAGRSWYYMTPTAAWMPVLVGLLERLRRHEVGWKWVAATGLSLGALFHAGNAQMWCYALLMFGVGLGVLIVCRALTTTRIIAAGSAILIGIAIALPLLIPQYLETAKLERSAGDSHVLRCLLSMLLPYPLAQAEYPGVTQTPNLDHMGHLYYAGTIFTIISLLGMCSLVAHRWSKRVLAANICLVLASVALILTLGRIGGLWYLLSKAPPFNGFKHAFKFIPFATLFMMLGGALLMERAIGHWKFKRPILERSVVAVVALLLGYHAWMSTPSFCDYAYRPYTSLPAEMQALNNSASPARMYAIGPRRSLAPEYGCSLMHQLPSVWGCYAFEGTIRSFDAARDLAPSWIGSSHPTPLPACKLNWALEIGLDESPYSNHDKIKDALHRSGMDEEGVWGRNFHIDLAQAITTLRSYGVRWVVLYTGPQVPQIPEGHSDEIFWRTDPVAEQIGEAVKERARLLVRNDAVCIYELKGATPLAFFSGKTKTPLPIRFTGAGAVVDTSSLTDEADVVVNVLQSPFFKACIDGKSVAATTDKLGRLVCHVPAGTRELRVGYQPPWMIGSVVGALLCAWAIACVRWRQNLADRAAQFVSRSKSPLILRLRSAA